MQSNLFCNFWDLQVLMISVFARLYSISISICEMGCVLTQGPKDMQKTLSEKREKLKTIDCRRKSTKFAEIILENVTIISEELTQSQINFCVGILKEHQLFSGLNQEQLQAVCKQMVWADGKKQQYLFQQGQTGHSFFLIQKGRVGVQIDGKKVVQMANGQFFGELALLFRTSRAASVKCLEKQNRFFVMKPILFRNILQQLKNVQYSQNIGIIHKISLFQSLTNKQKFSLANSIKMLKFKEDEVIFETGQISQGLYIISEGVIEIEMPEMLPITMSQYQIFGQNSLKDSKRRQGRAKCLLDATCLVIGKRDIEKALGSNLKSLIYYNTQKWALLRSGCFNNYNQAQLNNIVLGFQNIPIKQNQVMKASQFKGLVVALEGSINNLPQGTLFNIEKWKAGNDQGQKLVKNGDGTIGYLSFQKLTDIIRTIQDKQKLFRASQRCIPQVDSSLSLHGFEIIKKLGQGQFGQVFLIRNKQTGGGLYALKCISKDAVRQEQMEQSVIEEKKILQKAIFPFIVGFVKAFHDSSNVFLLMEYLKGKQMFEVIREMPTLSKPIARYYFGCIMLSIEYLHANNIIYRDIKPENSVVDHQGKVHLIDLGTAKELNQRNMFKTFTIIGTPHYMAPEVFEGKGYSFQADYWSLGVILYQFVCGKLPFGENINGDPYALYALIKKAKVEFPKFVTGDTIKGLIKFLLVKDPKLRSQQVSFDKIKRHDYYSGFHWDDLLEEKLIPPYIPRDFRSKMEQKVYYTGVPFLKQFYDGKQKGRIEQWDENIGFSYK